MGADPPTWASWTSGSAELAGRDVLLRRARPLGGQRARRCSPCCASAPARVTWATRSLNQRPCVEVADDPLPERAARQRGANDLAARPPAS